MLIDAKVLLAACGGDREILARISGALQNHLPLELTRAAESLRGRDASALREAAHRVYGMVSAISSQAGNVASELEDRAALGELEQSAPLLGQLVQMSQELLASIDSLSIEDLRARVAPTR
jgi:HPt (histidine-containing phosphotransfer) domain-containing protein